MGIEEMWKIISLMLEYRYLEKLLEETDLFMPQVIERIKKVDNDISVYHKKLKEEMEEKHE